MPFVTTGTDVVLCFRSGFAARGPWEATGKVAHTVVPRHRPAALPRFRAPRQLALLRIGRRRRRLVAQTVVPRHQPHMRVSVALNLVVVRATQQLALLRRRRRRRLVVHLVKAMLQMPSGGCVELPVSFLSPRQLLLDLPIGSRRHRVATEPRNQTVAPPWRSQPCFPRYSAV